MTRPTPTAFASAAPAAMRITRFSLGLALLARLAVVALANDHQSAVARASNFLGIPDVDFPILHSVPVTGFKCQVPGYFGDVDTRCQVFHICQSGGRHDSFLCPNGTLFNQKFLVCDWWFNVDCTGATTARWHDAPRTEDTPAADADPDAGRTVSVNRMGGAAAALAAESIAAVALEAFNSDESTTILPADELGVPLQIDLVEDPGVTAATERPSSAAAAADAPAIASPAEADAVTDASAAEASPRPSTHSRQGQPLTSPSESDQVAGRLVSEQLVVATTSQVTPIDSPVAGSWSPSTTERHSPDAEPLESTATSQVETGSPPQPSRTLEPPAPSAPEQGKRQHVKTGGVKHLDSKFGVRIGKKAHKSRLF